MRGRMAGMDRRVYLVRVLACIDRILAELQEIAADQKNDDRDAPRDLLREFQAKRRNMKGS